MDFIFIIIIAFVAAMIATLTGFGSATILTPFVAMVIDIKAAIVLVAFFHFANNVSKFVLMRKSINLRLVLVYGIPSVISALIGAWIFASIDVGLITIFFSIFLISFSIYSLFRPKFHIPEKDIILTIGGLISGLTSGLIGVGGAIRSMFLISTFLKKEALSEKRGLYCHCCCHCHNGRYIANQRVHFTRCPLPEPHIVDHTIGSCGFPGSHYR
jgi:uncharacterized membrane protein YfcA